MTHSLTIELPEVVYRSLSEDAAQKGKKAEDVAAEMVELMMRDRKSDDEDFEHLADELADYFEKSLPPDAKPLSEFAMSREGIYEDHP